MWRWIQSEFMVLCLDAKVVQNVQRVMQVTNAR